jgi:hypothetical protein
LILLLTRYAMSKNTGVSRYQLVFCSRSGSYQLVASRMTYQGSIVCARTPFWGPFFFLLGSMCCSASLRIWKCCSRNVSSMSESVKIVIRISISEQGLSWHWRGIGGVRMFRYD